MGFRHINKSIKLKRPVFNRRSSYAVSSWLIYMIFVLKLLKNWHFSNFEPSFWRYFGSKTEILIFRIFRLTFFILSRFGWNLVEMMALTHSSFYDTIWPHRIINFRARNVAKSSKIYRSPCRRDETRLKALKTWF